MAGFPTTRRSAIVGLSSLDGQERARSLEALLAAYWKPVYKYVRLRFQRSPEDAQDLTQAFFLKLIEKNYLEAYEPSRGRFRTFLRTCLDRFLAKERKAERALKRGGDATIVSLDFAGAERELVQSGAVSCGSNECDFEREWVRSLLGNAVDVLRRACQERGRESAFLIFERYDLEEPAPGHTRPTYDALALALGLPVTTVTNQLAWARRELRRLLLERLRELTASEEEFRLEARVLLGLDAP